MNLQKLFEAQKVLDERIIKEKGLERQDLLPNKILALQVELGELANEWRGFKHWSNDREPKTKVPVGMNLAEAKEVFDGRSPNRYKNPLLEEYVDCLHFMLSIGLEIQYTPSQVNVCEKDKDDTIFHFSYVFCLIGDFWNKKGYVIGDEERYRDILSSFLFLGKRLGFTWEQIEQAYFEKNKVNHERQTNGY